MGRPPHEVINAKRVDPDEREAEIAALEAKYGVPYDQLPDPLKFPPPTHPQRTHARRFNYPTQTAFNWNYASRATRRRLVAAGSHQVGWREKREHHLNEVEQRRRAEIALREQRHREKRLHAKWGGRTPPRPKNQLALARKAVERRELREGIW